MEERDDARRPHPSFGTESSAKVGKELGKGEGRTVPRRPKGKQQPSGMLHPRATSREESYYQADLSLDGPNGRADFSSPSVSAPAGSA